jgi:hypothetical protein
VAGAPKAHWKQQQQQQQQQQQMSHMLVHKPQRRKRTWKQEEAASGLVILARNALPIRVTCVLTTYPPRGIHSLTSSLSPFHRAIRPRSLSSSWFRSDFRYRRDEAPCCASKTATRDALVLDRLPSRADFESSSSRG